MEKEIERLLERLKNQAKGSVMITRHRYALQDFQEFGYKVIHNEVSLPKSHFKMVRVIGVYGSEGEELVDVDYCLKKGTEPVCQYPKENILKANLVPVASSQLVDYFEIDETEIVYHSKKNEKGYILVKTFNHSSKKEVL